MKFSFVPDSVAKLLAIFVLVIGLSAVASADSNSTVYDPTGPWGRNLPDLQMLGARGGDTAPSGVTVQPAAAVPEPATFALVLVGGAGGLALRLKRKKS